MTEKNCKSRDYHVFGLWLENVSQFIGLKTLTWSIKMLLPCSRQAELLPNSPYWQHASLSGTWCHHFFLTLSSLFRQLLVNSSLEAISSNHLPVISNAVLPSPEPKTAVIGRRILGCQQLRLQPCGFISGERTRSFWAHYLFILYSDADPVCPPTRPGVATCRLANTLCLLLLLIQSDLIACSAQWSSSALSRKHLLAGIWWRDL